MLRYQTQLKTLKHRGNVINCHFMRGKRTDFAWEKLTFIHNLAKMGILRKMPKTILFSLNCFAWFYIRTHPKEDILSNRLSYFLYQDGFYYFLYFFQRIFGHFHAKSVRFSCIKWQFMTFLLCFKVFHWVWYLSNFSIIRQFITHYNEFQVKNWILYEEIRVRENIDRFSCRLWSKCD